MRSAKRTWWSPGGKRRLRVTTDGHEHVADAARRELERRAQVLDLDDRLDRHAGLLGARVDLQPGRILGGVARVGQDQRPAGELGRASRGGARGAGCALV